MREIPHHQKQFLMKSMQPAMALREIPHPLSLLLLFGILGRRRRFVRRPTDARTWSGIHLGDGSLLLARQRRQNPRVITQGIKRAASEGLFALFLRLDVKVCPNHLTSPA
jgi:hypothetical protein